MPVYVTFERGRDDAEPLHFGPFEWVQVTYGALRLPPNGEDLATFDYGGTGDWIIDPAHLPPDAEPNYSDFIVTDGPQR